MNTSKIHCAKLCNNIEKCHHPSAHQASWFVPYLDFPFRGCHQHHHFGNAKRANLWQSGPMSRKNKHWYMCVSKKRVPQNGWFIMENLIKRNEFGGTLFSETPISWWSSMIVPYLLLTCFSCPVNSAKMCSWNVLNKKQISNIVWSVEPLEVTNFRAKLRK